MRTADLYAYFKRSSGVSIDTRSISEGNMFFALKGPNFDGHKYINKAFENGASYVIIDDPQYKNIENTCFVKNVEESLQNLAKYHRCMVRIPVIGITGSNGKTTTKELMASVLKSKYSVFATKGNLNNHLGVPLSILSIEDSHQLAIIEMGANHLGEIKFLSEMSMPDFGLITNIGKAHLEGFGDLDGVRKGKTELYKYLESTGGTIFYNMEDELLRKSLPMDTTTISYSSSDAQVVSSYPFVGFEYMDQIIQSNLNGAYNVTNMMAAITVGEYFGLSVEDIKKGIESYIPENNRSQVKNTKDNVLIMDAYNANPSSMVESITNFNAYPNEKKTLILGHMLELGDSAKEEHLSLIDFISRFEWNNVFLVGSEFIKLKAHVSYKIFVDTEELSQELKKIDLKGEAILLKGSRGIALENCIEYL